MKHLKRLFKGLLHSLIATLLLVIVLGAVLGLGKLITNFPQTTMVVFCLFVFYMIGYFGEVL